MLEKQEKVARVSDMSFVEALSLCKYDICTPYSLLLQTFVVLH